MSTPKYRLITRSDFDGLVCGMLLRELELIDDILFAHPKDMQDGVIAVSARDIVTNLPYVEGCHLAFDHHSSEVSRKSGRVDANHVIDAAAPSAARVVFEYYGGAQCFRNSRVRKSSTRKVGCC
jgi:oligoribonuclease NrnB/cAMP/cGMP phosphodiesterase (DHH superfamily)